MTDQHPITPPPELVQQWYEEAKLDPCGPTNWVAVKAAQYGADQELEACEKWLRSENYTSSFIAMFRAARRPKPPSLKELALEAFDRINDPEGTVDWDTIRRALEALPDDPA